MKKLTLNELGDQFHHLNGVCISDPSVVVSDLFCYIEP